MLLRRKCQLRDGIAKILFQVSHRRKGEGQQSEKPLKTTYYAHSTDRTDRSDWHKLSDHLREVGRSAESRGSAFGAGRAAALAGWLHDLGKYSTAFQRRLDGSVEKVDHSTAGAREVMRLASSPKDKLVAELIAYAIAGHHAGLPDKIAESGSLSDRLDPDCYEIEPLDAVWKTELTISDANLLPLKFHWVSDVAERAFQIAFLGRMIFSCLVDADFRDTERFYASVNAQNIDRDWPQLQSHLPALRAKFDQHIEELRGAGGESELNAIRRDILNHVRENAEMPPNVFTLNVPTGGGKTLASLGFALDHASRYGHTRIITAIPFTSVIDQTATIFRCALGESFVLEHHSAIDEERVHERESRDKLRLAMEDWAAPVVVTTNVQLFESLFSERPSRCRKLHNIANSVIILDEAQTIPLHVLRPSVAALKELTRNYGCTIVLCTATQPALDAKHVQWGFELSPARELAPDPDELHRKLRRVVLVRRTEPLSDDDLVDALESTERALVIVNSRKHALDLYRAVRGAGLAGVMHLSTRQTAYDRRTVLAMVKARLAAQQPCRLIATSLVEAGVDLDFPRVWRAETGLDQIIQAAGRCNREGGRLVSESVVTVFKPADAKAPREIQPFIDAMVRASAEHAELFSPAAITRYFREVYWQYGAIGLDRGVLDKQSILSKFEMSGRETAFSYRKAAANFRLIQSGMVPIVVPADDGASDWIAKLGVPSFTSGRIARELQTYLVQVPPSSRLALIQNGRASFRAADMREDQFAVLDDMSLYNSEVGLLWENPEYLSPEQLMV